MIQDDRDSKLAGVYRLTCLINGKIYFGETNNFHRRWLEYNKKPFSNLKYKSKADRFAFDNSYVWKTCDGLVLISKHTDPLIFSLLSARLTLITYQGNANLKFKIVPIL